MEVFMVFSFCHSGMHALWNAILAATPDEDFGNCVPFLSNALKRNTTATVIIKTAELLAADVTEWLRSDVAQHFLSWLQANVKSLHVTSHTVVIILIVAYHCCHIIHIRDFEALGAYSLAFLFWLLDVNALPMNVSRRHFNIWVCSTGRLLILWRARDWKTDSVNLNWGTPLFYFHVFFICNHVQRIWLLHPTQVHPSPLTL